MLDQKLAEIALSAFARNKFLHPLANVTQPLPILTTLKMQMPKIYKGVFWKEIYSVDQCKIEKNTITQQYRLLDQNSNNCFWGTEDEMEEFLIQLIKRAALQFAIKE